MKRIEDFFVGQSATLEQKITPEIVEKFVELTGDNNPLHVDPVFAEKSSFKGIVTHGMLSAAFISTMIGKNIPGDGALWVSQNLKFHLPVRLNDSLTIVTEITKISVKERLLDLKTEIFNQYKQKVLSGEGQVILLQITEGKAEVVKSPNNEQRIALVTGASRGLGSEIARKLASEGYTVVINYRHDVVGAESLSMQLKEAGYKSILHCCDVSKEKEVEKMFGTIVSLFGKIDVLVNNASPKIVENKIYDMEWADFEFQINGQLKAAVICSGFASKLMCAKGSGVIINIGSTVAIGTPPPKWAAYNVAKAALLEFTKCQAVELGPLGVRANMVTPGMTETRMIAEISEKQRLLYAAQTPMRRLATTSDIAEAVYFLSSENASFINGENLIVSGGKVMH